VKLILKEEHLFISLLILFYSIGAIGSTLPSHSEWFLSLTPFNLLLTFSIVILSKKTKKKSFIIFLISAFIIGISIELIGVHTGLLFGNYRYGENLGVKVFDVPLVIGLNWGIVAVSASSLMARTNLNTFGKIVFGGTLMTILDVLIEPISAHTDFWYWKDNIIPSYNFICWFITGIVIQSIFYGLKLEEKNKVFEVLLLVMVVFFIILNVHYL
jgi:putative membrane protein